MKSSALRAQVEAALEKRVPAPFSWRERVLPETLSTGIAALDELTGGLPRGALVEICGAASSGRTTLLLSVLASATQRGEACALVDAGDALDPAAASAAGVELERLLWVRCGGQFRVSSFKFREKRKKDADFPRLEQALRAADLIVQSGGFGVVALDLAGIAPRAARRVPLASWFRFRRAVEGTSTVLLLLEQEAVAEEAAPGAGGSQLAGSCASLVLRLRRGDEDARVSAARPSHAELLAVTEFSAEVLRAPGRRKPAQSVRGFRAVTPWAG
jgi:recombination protein RecA